MNDIKSFVMIKYKIITSDTTTWDICDTYPDSVKINWAWRCAYDAEHLVIKLGDLTLVDIAKKYKDGFATHGELMHARDYKTTGYNHAAYAFFYAAICLESSTDNYTVCAVSNAAHALSGDPGFANDKFEEKFDQYIKWLIEELCEYESKQHE